MPDMVVFKCSFRKKSNLIPLSAIIMCMDNIISTKLLQYIKSLPDFEIQNQIDAYDHMGALIVDGILQAALTYETVVLPRVNMVLQKYPDIKTTSGFKKVCENVGIKNIINWNGDKKANYILSLLDYLISENLETVSQLRIWLSDSDNKARFINENKGIGAVTAEYFRILAGDESVKIDRHLRNFLADANMPQISDDEAIKVLSDVAQRLGTTPSILDHSIWTYQSVKK